LVRQQQRILPFSYNLQFKNFNIYPTLKMKSFKNIMFLLIGWEKLSQLYHNT